MHQESWNYNGRLKKHHILLNHYHNSQDVSIRLNGVVLFHESLSSEETKKSFQFFIDSELCEINITKENNTYQYQFTSHPYSTSQLGRQRKFKAQLQEWGIATGMIAVCLMIFVPAIYYFFVQLPNRQNLDLGGMITAGVVTKIDPISTSKTLVKNANAYYKFLVNDDWFQGKTTIKRSKSGKYITENGLPLAAGCEFEVLFSGINPEKSRMLFKKPTDQQASKYCEIASEPCLYNPPPEIDSDLHSDYCKCISKGVYYRFGLDGIAHILSQNEPHSRLNKYNQKTFERLTQKNTYKEIIVFCKDFINNPEEENTDAAFFFQKLQQISDKPTPNDTPSSKEMVLK